MTIYPVARLPDKWIEQARDEGAHIDPALKSPWQLFAAFEKSEPGGFVGLLLVGKRKAHIRGWYVFPDQRGDGLGGKLLDHALDWARVHGYHNLDIRTTHDVEWAGFTPTDNVTKEGERQYVLELVA